MSALRRTLFSCFCLKGRVNPQLVFPFRILLTAYQDSSASWRTIRLGLCNIFHGCVHNMLHNQSEDTLLGLYKAATFVIQAIRFQETGDYIGRQADLLPRVSSRERVILENYRQQKNRGRIPFREMAETLFTWAQSQFQNT